MKRKTLIATGVTAAAVLALGGGYAYSVTSDRPVVGVAQATVAPMSVTVNASGSLIAAHSAGVYPPAAGTVASVTVHDGDKVSDGDILAVMAKGPLKLAVAQARAAHTAAQAQLAAVNDGVPSAIQHSAASAALSAARSQVSTAKQNYAAYLADYRDASSSERKTMRSTLRTLRTAKATADAALKSAQAGLDTLAVAGRVSLARTAAAQAVSATAKALAVAEDDLEGAALRAPFDGTVTWEGTMEKGSALTPGIAAFTVVDATRMAFEAQVFESDISSVEADQKATITLDAFDDTFAGAVERVQASPVTTSTGTIAFPVRVSLEAGHARLFQGMSGSAEIEVESIPDALIVPVEAVLTSGGEKTVFVLDAGDVAHATAVRIGASTDTAAQVVSGLSAGDRVVTTGASSLSDGQRVSTR
ncbi:efflux RND transporter periplasmic adaptor subunit [Propionicimonas sp.]|uniref:efflux RND transporter periplasmic adaptor subunit n=1 Tax=Propionicimonas sp. TaxID=1955623 RepID=UPI0039E3CB70